MAGWRLAFAAGNQEMIEALNLIQDHLFVSVYPAVQDAGIVALESPERDPEIAKLVALYQSRRDAFVNAAEKSAGMRLSREGLSTPGCPFRRDIPVNSSPMSC